MEDDPRAPERRFAAEVVHELNNALTAIVGLAEKLESDARLEDDVRSQVGVIAAQGRRLRHLSERLAAFSRGQAAPPPGAASEAGSRLLPGAGARVEPQPGGSLLLVDDEEMIRTIVSWQLQGMGHDVVAVESAEQALETYESGPERFRLALIDVVLPGRSGLDLAHDLRRRSLPVILLSGTPLDPQADLDVPCLTKPVPLLELQRAVADALSPKEDAAPRI